MKQCLILLLFLNLFSNVSFSQSKRKVESKPVIKKSKNEQMEIVGDSIKIPAFEIELKLSKRAEEKLAKNKESIIVLATIFGEPKSDPNKEGPITLSYSKIELTNKRKVIFNKIKILKSTYNALKNKVLWITVEVSSVRKSIKENFLDTDFLEEDLDKVISKNFVLNGKLIGE